MLESSIGLFIVAEVATPRAQALETKTRTLAGSATRVPATFPVL